MLNIKMLFVVIIFAQIQIPRIVGQRRWGGGGNGARGMPSSPSFASRWTIPEILPNFGFDDEDDAAAGFSNNNYGTSPNGATTPVDHSQMDSFAVVSRPPVVIPSISRQTATLIFFHGMGDQGDGWAQTFRSDFLPYLAHVKFVCPNAKSAENGMTQWFEYQGLDPSAPEDLAGLNSVKNYAHSLIENEIAVNGIAPNRIFLGGFSQGGPVALYAALSYPQPLGGIICLSGFLLPRDILAQPIRQIPWLNQSNMEIPIFIGHGQDDPNVPYSNALMTGNALKRFDPNVQFRSYQMGHETCAAEIGEIIQFIRTIAP